MTSPPPEQWSTIPDSALPAWYDLGRRALYLAFEDDVPGGIRAVEEMARTHGPGSVPQAMQAWIDTVLDARGLPEPVDSVVLTFTNADTGQVSGADDVPPHWALAGRLVAARAADDQDTYRALLDAVPDNKAWAQAVTTVLIMCALQLRGQPLSVPDPRGG